MRSFSLGLLLLSAVLSPSLGQQQQTPGGLKHVTASVNFLWGVTTGDNIYKCAKPCKGSNWVLVAGSLKQIDAGDEEVWGFNSLGMIWKRPVDWSGRGWTHISGRLNYVSASGNDSIWSVKSNGLIFICKKPCTGSWINVDGQLKQIDGGYAYVYGVNFADDIWTRPIDGSGSWHKIPGKLKQITGGGDDELFGVNAQDQIFRCKPCIGNWERVEGALSQCDASIDEVYRVNPAGNKRQVAIWK